MRLISNRERRSRLALRHALASPAGSPQQAAEHMVCLHSSDPATVFLSLWARVAGVTQADIEAVLYEDRSLARVLGMRRTLWVAPSDFAPIINASSTVALQARELKRTVDMIESVGVVNGSE